MDSSFENPDICIEIGGDKLRVVITTDPDDCEGQAQAHKTLARIAPQLMLLQAALEAK